MPNADTLDATISLLRSVEGFGALDEAILAKMAAVAQQRHVPRGEVLIEEGQPADNLYIVLRGRFVVLVGQSAIAEISRGEPIGELAFFAGGTRTANVVAARNSIVMSLSRDAYDDLSAATPALSQDILAALSRRLAKTITDSPELRPKAGKVCSIFPGRDAALDSRFSQRLKQAFEDVEGWSVIDETNCPTGAIDDPAALSAWLDEQEAQCGNLVLICTDPARTTAWSKCAADNSDTVLLVVEKVATTDDVSPSVLEQNLLDTTLKPNIQLVLYRQETSQPTTDTARWLDNRDVALHHHIALDSEADFARLGRFVRGEAIGLVLCGGGSFGTAHLGVIQALHERGYTFDFYGGTSIGAAMGGSLAIGLSTGRIMDLCEDLFIKSKAMSRFTVPKHSVFDHHRLDTALMKHFGRHNIEDMPINFFAVATSLTDNDVAVMRRGPLWQALRASASLPGVFPPFIKEDGEVLIDGGLIDNVPITVMRNLKSGPNLVLNFLTPKPWRTKARYGDLPTRGQAIASLVTPAKKGHPKAPSVMSVLSRAMVVGARRLLKQTDIGTDVLLNISPLRGMSFMDWTRGRELFKTSYAQMSKAMDQVKDIEITASDPFVRLREAAKTINQDGTDAS